MSQEEIENQIQGIVARSRAAREEAADYLFNNGETLDLGKWVTLKEYKERFGLKSINVLTNWIRRGIIPPENVRIVKALNGLRLVKAVPYREA
ncbi:hypothetical protein [Dyadobacter sp. 32]|uniref:hypothetical protein n=1 Tax=Dyadobacter sp. 32 TaxID=538966 RepID=UPI0011F0296E